jgi:hypothetical protein
MSDDLIRRLELWESERPDPGDGQAWRAWLECQPEMPIVRDARANQLVFKTRENARVRQDDDGEQIGLLQDQINALEDRLAALEERVGELEAQGDGGSNE